MKAGTCPKCGSTKIMTDVTVRDIGSGGPYPLRVAVEEQEPANHGILWTPKQVTGDVRAWICAECGYTELFTTNLDELYELYMSHKDKQ